MTRERAVYARIMGRVWDERCRPRPPVRMSMRKVREARGVWRVRRRGRRVIRRGWGSRERRRIGRRVRNAVTWWGEVKDDDCVVMN